MTDRVGSLAAAVLLSVGALVVLSMAVAGTPAGASAGVLDGGIAEPGTESGPAASPDEIDPDTIEIDVELAEDGAADWEIQFLVVLEDDDAKAAFAELEEDVAEDPEAYTERFADRIDATVDNAASATDRTMAADGYEVRTDRQSLTREYGVLTYSFRWHGFAAVEDDELHAGDAIDRYYLDDDTRLAISWPAEYDLQSVSPTPDDERDQAVIWRGSETDFVTGEPRLVVAQERTLPAALFVVAGVAAVAVAGVVATWWIRRRGGSDAVTPGPEDGSAGAERAATVGDAAHKDSAEDAREDSAKDVQEDGADDESAGDTDRRSSTAAEPDPDEFLSNEERVLRLLEARGGRLKQQQVVQELGWTDAKTSQVVTGLREDGELESFRLGRENVLVLPEEADDALESDI